MRRLELALLLSGAFAFAACSSSTTNPGGKAGSDGGAGHGGAGGGGTGGGGTGGGGTGGGGTGGGGTGGATAGSDGGTDTPQTDATTSDATDGGGSDALTPQQSRGSYLVNAVLGCGGCHSPRASGDAAAPVPFSGIDCFVNTTSEAGTNCLSSANLTNDPAGLKNLTDQQVMDAFRKGIYPGADAGTQFLFSNMPYYQFSNLTDADAMAIVAYLRTLTPSSHVPATDTGSFATRPTAAQWAPVTLADLPSPVGATADGGADGGSDAGSTSDAGTASLTNGKYLAALACSVCHTQNTAATMPFQLDATKAYWGGKIFPTTVTVPVDAGADAGDAGDAGTMTVSKMIESSNLTPDQTTGLGMWTTAQIVTTIKTAKDEAGRTTCSPMRALPNITDQDANDIANYLKAIAAASNAITMTCE
jgi:cytochrome c1